MEDQLARSAPAAAGDSLDDETRGRIDAIFAEWTRPGSPGCALTVTLAGRTVHKGGYGLANLEYGIPITPSTVFHVASVSKQFTAYATLLLAREGRLSLDDEVRKHLPWVPDLGAEITLRHLMHHTSGIRDQWEMVRFAGWRMDDVISQEHLLSMVGRQRDLNFPPGSEHLYCNTGYTLLAETVAAVSGRTFREFTAERIFRPLGMNSTFFFTDHEELVTGRAYSYANDGAGGFKKSVLSFANAGATSLFTTADDLAKWLLHLDSIEGSQEAREMQTCFTLTGGETIAYAAGLSVETFRTLRRVGHSGSDAGFRSYCGRFPDQQLGIAVLANLGSMDPDGLAMKVAEVLLGGKMPAPDRESPGAGTPVADLAPYTGSYVTLFMGIRVEVAQAGGHLVLKIGDMGERRLVPARQDTFWTAEMGEVTFHREGETVDAISSTGLKARRIQPPLPPAEAGCYVGDYYSAELDTTYRIRTRGLEITVEHQRLPCTPLVPVGKDQLQADRRGGGLLAFDRDACGQVTGFRLSGGRCRNLRFHRVAEFRLL